MAGFLDQEDGFSLLQEDGSTLSLEDEVTAQTFPKLGMNRGPSRVGPPVLALEPRDRWPAVGPFARTAQTSAEVLVLPTSQRARVAQTSAEVLVLPTSQRARIAQVSVEVLTLAIPKARVAQVSVEVLQTNHPKRSYSVVWGD